MPFDQSSCPYGQNTLFILHYHQRGCQISFQDNNRNMVLGAAKIPSIGLMKQILCDCKFKLSSWKLKVVLNVHILTGREISSLLNEQTK